MNYFVHSILNQIEWPSSAHSIVNQFLTELDVQLCQKAMMLGNANASAVLK